MKVRTDTLTVMLLGGKSLEAGDGTAELFAIVVTAEELLYVPC